MIHLVSRQWNVAILTLLWFSAEPACAVVVSASNLDVTAVAPGDDPGWNNVVYRGSASAVYLGNRWVLTANHVGAGSIRLSDGRVFDMTTGSGVQLNNTGIAVAGSPDLEMFRLTDDPGLPALQIDTVRPAAGSPVVMIGDGYDRASINERWRVSGSGTSTTWTPISTPFANALGYDLLSSATKRWGMNEVSSGQTLINSTTLGFATRFDRLALPFEAQAVTGDSGGGVFHYSDGAWKLVGIMDAIQTLTNQPSGTAVFGDQTMIADLSAYRSQIMDLVTRADPAWQNQHNYYDVDGSGFVSPLDYLLIFNELNRSQQHDLVGSPATTREYYDVSGDNFVSQLDALQIINALTADTANPSSAFAADPNVVLAPEPATGVMVLWGVLLAAAWRCVCFVRRRCAE